ncbi:hypothetical protein D9M69_246780 [compost metagenome]
MAAQRSEIGLGSRARARDSQRQNSDVLELETGDGPAVDGAVCEVERSDGGPWILPVSDLGPFLSSPSGFNSR